MYIDVQTNLLGNVLKKFCEDFISEVSDMKETLKKMGINVDDALPEPFKGQHKIRIQAYYSQDRKQLFVIFNKAESNNFSFSFVKGNPIPFQVFNFVGEGKESSIRGGTFINGNQKITIDYSFIFPHSAFIKRLNNIKEFAIDFIKVHLDQYNYDKKNKDSQYVKYLEQLKQQMSDLFFDETTRELTIDKFLEENPVILEHGLQLIKLKHQVVLKNILNKYEHDLKPDLIAFDLAEKNWVIVDYKKAKSSIMKNLNKVRTGFKSDVNDLENQLFDYMEYFDEKDHRDYVIKEYQMKINFPKCIGVIGNVKYEEQQDFNRLMKKKPRWFSVIPYNYLFDSFGRYIELVKDIGRK
ncbi:hypothetical protein ACQKML_13595 [Peribacillus frigoritolerans]